MRTLLSFALSVASLLVASGASADEGMWTFDAVPVAQIQAKYGFSPDQKWLDTAQKSAVRLSSGCSGSFVSKTGLIVTASHCVRECVDTLSKKDIDYDISGFVAAALSDEVRCPNLSFDVLLSTSDVTPQINRLLKGVQTADRSAALTAITTILTTGACEKQGDEDAENLFCKVVPYFGGERFKLNKYKAYYDVRLVFAPEALSNDFGGEAANFNFPRYSFDVAFLRAYAGEAPRPISTPDFLPWTTRLLSENELVFSVGNPGFTRRNLTVAQLMAERDLVLKTALDYDIKLAARLENYVELGPEQALAARTTLSNTHNSNKAAMGQLAALAQPDFIARKKAQEREFRRRVRRNPALSQRIGNPWAEIETSLKSQSQFFSRYFILEQVPEYDRGVIKTARLLSRLASEAEKPASSRMERYKSYGGFALLNDLSNATQRSNSDLSELTTKLWLSQVERSLGGGDPLVRQLLGGNTSGSIAENAILGTKLTGDSQSFDLINSGIRFVRDSNDPMVSLLNVIEPEARALKIRYDREVEEPIENAANRIESARFAIYGAALYPDADFTLRLNFGRLEGWREADVVVPSSTTIGGMFAVATDQAPYLISARWRAAQSKLDMSLPYNMSTSTDSVGGSSGSPIIDRQGRVVGLLFDGNSHSTGGTYTYDETLHRSISVTSVAISHILSKVYAADRIVLELNAERSAQ